MPKKGVLFDFWGTLVDNGLRPSPVRRTKKILNLKMPFQDYIERFERSFMTQDFDDLHEAFHSVCEEFELDASDRVIDRCVEMWGKNDELAEPYDDTDPILDMIAPDHKLGLVSNSPPTIRTVIDRFDLRQFFDTIVLSCDVGLLKTDPEMFEIALDDLDLETDDVIMVGDSLHTDVKGAKAAGIKPVLADRRESRNFKPKITKMEEVFDHI